MISILNLFLLFVSQTTFSQGFLQEINIENELGFKKKSFKFENKFDSIWLKSIDINDDNLMGFIDRAQNKIKFGFYKEAIKDLDRAIALDSTYAASYILKGVVSLNKDSIENAYNLFKRAIKYDNNDPLYFYYLGQSQIILDSLKQARNSFRTSIKIDPNFALGYFSLGNYYSMKPNFIKAKSYFKKAIEVDPSYAEAYTSKGVLELLLGQQGAALKTFDKATEVNPNFAGAYFMRGYIYVFRNKLSKTLFEWNKAIAIDTTNSFYRLARGALYIYEKHYHLAYEDIRTSLKLTPIKRDRFKDFSKRVSLETMQAVQTQVNIFERHKKNLKREQIEEIEKCIALFLIENHREADKIYGKLIEQSPHNSLFFFLRAYNSEFRYKKTEAADYYKIAISGTPKIDEALLRLGIIYNESGEHVLAEEIISRYIAKNDTECIAYRYRGISRVYLGLDKEGLMDFNKFLSIDSTDWDIKFNRANVFSRLGKTSLAIRDFSDVIKLRPRDKESYYLRGICYYNSGDTLKALTDMDSAISINKYYLDAIYSKAFMNMERKKFKDALTGFNEVLNENPNHSSALYHRAAIYFDTKNYPLALTDYNSIINKNSNNPDIYYFRGLTYLRLNQTKNACDDFEKAVKMGNLDAKRFIDKYCK